MYNIFIKGDYMSKLNVFVGAICFLVFIASTVLYFLFDEFAFAFYMIVALIIAVNFIIRRSEREKFNSLLVSYTLSCDIDGYIENLNRYQKRFFQTKNVKIMYDLYKAKAYIDKGEFSIAKDYLLRIDNEEKRLNSVATFLYLKTWNDYFYYTNDLDKMEKTLLKMKDILDHFQKKRNLGELIQLYCVQEFKYYILNNENMDKAKEFFLKRKKMMPKMGMLIISNEYQLGLISLMEKDYYSAYNIFKRINSISLKDSIKSKVYLLNKSKEYEERLKQYVDIE